MVESKKIRGNGESFFISKEVKLRVPGSRTCPQLKFYSFCNKLSGTTGKKSVPASVPQEAQSDLSSLQVCLCRTPLSYEQGQNQKETSLSPNQHCSPVPPCSPSSGHRAKCPCSLQCPGCDQDTKDKAAMQYSRLAEAKLGVSHAGNQESQS